MNSNQEPDNVDEQKLVEKYQKSGDLIILNDLLERWSEISMGVAMQVMRNKSDAEDMVQEAYIKIIKNINKFPGGYSVRSWVRKIVFNTCLNKKSEETKRKSREIKVSEKSKCSPKDNGLDDSNIELFETIKKKWDSLPQRYRMPVWMRYYEKMTFKDIAMSLSLSENTVKSQSQRGLEKLKDILMKSGITLTTVLLTNALAFMETGASTEMVKSQIPSIIDATRNAQSLVLVNSSISSLKIFSLISLSAVLIIIFNGDYLSHYVNKNVDSDKRIEKTPTYWTADFNEGGVPEEITVTHGNVERVPEGDYKTSGHLKTSVGTTVFKLKTSDMKLPLKLSFSLASYDFKSKNSNLVLRSTFSWVCQLNRWGEIDLVNILNEWLEVDLYLTDRAIVSYVKGKKSYLNIYSKNTGENDSLTFILTGGYLLDNMKIESITSEDVPNIQKELNAVDEIPEEQKSSNINSEIMGHKNKKIELLFRTLKQLDEQILKLKKLDQ